MAPRAPRGLCGLLLSAGAVSGLRLAGQVTQGRGFNATKDFNQKWRPFDTVHDLNWYKFWWDCREDAVPLPQQADPQGRLQTVHVVYSADAAELPGVLLSMNSVSRHLSRPHDCVIHLIVAKADMEGAEKLVQCFSRGISETRALPSVVLHEMQTPDVNVTQLKERQFFRPDLLMPNTFVRFYLHEYMPYAPRAVWLDADTIVRTDIAELYRMRLRSASVSAMLPEAGFVHHAIFYKALEKGNFPNETEYNSGVVLLDLDKWRSDNYTKESEYWTMRFDGLGGDQVGLNMAMLGKIDMIPDWRWNSRGFHVGGGIPWRCADESKIIHWSGSRNRTLKPWQIGQASDEKKSRFRYDLVEPYELQPACELG